MLDLSLKIPEKLEPFLTKKKRYKVAFGGRGAAKSMSITDILLMKAQTERAKIGCIREYQNSLEDSVYSLLKSEIKRLKIPGFTPIKSQIKHKKGGAFRFRGLARSIEAIKSMFGFKYFWLEEGQFISDDSLKILTPTLREEDSELWISANPLSSADPFSQRFIVPYQKELDKNGFYEDDLHYIVKINWRDNPWFPDALEQERQHDFINLPRALYDHIWEGAFNDSVEDSIILAEWFDAAIDAHDKLGFDPTGVIIASHDPSDLGTDDKGFVLRQGPVILEAEARSFGDVNEGMDWALGKAIDAQADCFVWDCDGLGLSLKRQVHNALKNKKFIDYYLFHGSASPENPLKVYDEVKTSTGTKQRTNQDVFYNLRAQKYWDLRNRFFKTYLAVEKGKYSNPDELISISSTIEDMKILRSEICRIPRKFNASGKIQIMGKKEMKKMKIQSPNVSDSVMMSGITPAPQYEDAGLVFETVY